MHTISKYDGDYPYLGLEVLAEVEKVEEAREAREEADWVGTGAGRGAAEDLRRRIHVEWTQTSGNKTRFNPGSCMQPFRAATATISLLACPGNPHRSLGMVLYASTSQKKSPP